MNIKKLKFTPLLIIIITIGIGFSLLGGVSFGCACISSDHIIRSEYENVKGIIQQSVNSEGRYPSFEVMNEICKGEKHKCNIHEHIEENIKKPGVYYNAINNGNSYILEGYAEGERNKFLFFLGKEKVLANVNDKNVMFVY